jgi:hypothetical protein
VVVDAHALAEQLWRERGIRVHPRTIEKALSRRKKGALSNGKSACRRGTGTGATKDCVQHGFRGARRQKQAWSFDRDCWRGCEVVQLSRPRLRLRPPRRKLRTRQATATQVTRH